MKIMSLLLVVMAVTGMFFSAPAWAGDTDVSGSKLRAVVNDYLKSAPATDQEANKIREAGAQNAASSPGLIELICGIEMASIVGKVIWENRRVEELCPYKSGMSEFQYCVVYSKNADHFIWSPSTLTSKGCP